MSNAFNKFVTTIPKVYHPDTNRVMAALLTAIAASDDDVETSIALGKAQLFVRTATGVNLDIIANTMGVQRPPTLGLPDEDFQELIPNLSLKPKQIRKAFYDTADVFWGPLFSRINITSNNFAPFDVITDDLFTVSVDGKPAQSVKVLAGDIAALGLATAVEMQRILSRIEGITVEILTDSLTSNQRLNIRTNTPGSTGSIEILPCSMVSPSKLDFDLGKLTILNLNQRVVVYNIRPNELFIEIPAIIPALKRTLKGSHHFHADATLEPPILPANGVWAGSFFYNPTGSVTNFTITGQKTQTTQTINKDSVYVSMAVASTASFLNPTGQVIFGFGTSTQEGPVKYRGIPNTNTILLDPAYVFKNDHPTGTYVNVISQQKPYIPRIDGTDLAIYLTSPSGARQIVQDLLASLAAAGILVKFRVLAPQYRYLLDNPYILSDDEPKST